MRYTLNVSRSMCVDELNIFKTEKMMIFNVRRLL